MHIHSSVVSKSTPNTWLKGLTKACPEVTRILWAQYKYHKYYGKYFCQYNHSIASREKGHTKYHNKI